jgi:amino acid transporter
LSQASFAYVGVEITAASALEAGWRETKFKDDDESLPKRNKMPEALVSNTIRSASMYFPIATTIFYTVGILLVSLAVPSDHCDLPRMDWVHNFNCTTDNGTYIIQSSQDATSAFTIAARMSGIPQLADVLNILQVFTAFFCASTNLYVASRTIFSMTCYIDDGIDQTWFLRWLAKLGKTNHRKVPLRAIVFSALAFSWVPLLQLIKTSAVSKSYGGV